jgi:hypothetical protein
MAAQWRDVSSFGHELLQKQQLGKSVPANKLLTYHDSFPARMIHVNAKLLVGWRGHKYLILVFILASDFLPKTNDLRQLAIANYANLFDPNAGCPTLSPDFGEGWAQVIIRVVCTTVEERPFMAAQKLIFE